MVTLSKDRARPIFRRAHLPRKVHYIIIPKGSEEYFVFRGTPLSMSRSHCCIKKTLPCSLRSCPPWEVEDKRRRRLGRSYLCSLAGCPCRGVGECPCIWGKPKGLGLIVLDPFQEEDSRRGGPAHMGLLGERTTCRLDPL